MADHHEEEKKAESLTEKINEKNHGHDSSTSASSSSSSSSSDSEDDEKSSSKTKAPRLFGREMPVHKLLGGGKPADVFMWKDPKVSGGVLGGATVIWLLFDVLEYHLLSFVCHGLILGLVILFLLSNASVFIKKIPPHIPEIRIPEEHVLNIVSIMRIQINQAFAVLREIASGKDIKSFLSVIAGLWVLSFLGSFCDFIALLYTITVLLFTVPIFYDKNEDQVDVFAAKALVEIKKQYAVFDAKVLSKIPRGPLKDKKID